MVRVSGLRLIRIATDVVCVILGVSLFMLAGGTFSEVGAIAGVGTIITAFFMGPLIDLFNRKIAVPFLERGNKETEKND